MKVLIITATYNSKNELLATYESIKQQTYNNWEWLVTDDCSTDKTVLFLDELANSDDRINVLNKVLIKGLRLVVIIHFHMLRENLLLLLAVMIFGYLINYKNR